MSDLPNEKMPVRSHLEELRTRLVRSLVAVGLGMALCYYFREELMAVITRPLVAVMPKGTHLVFTGLPEAFLNYLKISFFSALVLTAPYILYQLWKFISPGLYVSERKYVLPFVLSSTILFAGGVLFGYFLVLPPAFSFFMQFSTDFLRPMLSLREYLSFALKLLLVFGIVFEIPVVIFFLSRIGVVNPRMLSRQRKYAILLIFVIAAILTPTPDAFTQIMMALPMMVLYEAGILVARWGERRARRQDQ
jgi:sec-independent protein translocase protein TatC